MNIFECAKISALQSKAGFKAVARDGSEEVISQIEKCDLSSELKALIYNYNRADAIDLIDQSTDYSISLWKYIFDHDIDLKLLSPDDFHQYNLSKDNIGLFAFCKTNNIMNCYIRCNSNMTIMSMPMEDLKKINRAMNAVRLTKSDNLKKLVPYAKLLDFLYQKNLIMIDLDILGIKDPDKVLKTLIKINFTIKDDYIFKECLWFFKTLHFNANLLLHYLRKGCPRVNNDMEFMNICTDNRYANLFSRDMLTTMKKIIIEAVSKKKNHFLEILNKRPDIEFDPDSVFNRETVQCLNLNELAESDIIKLANVTCYMKNNGYSYTGREFLLVNEAKHGNRNSNAQDFYESMTGSIDDKVLKFKQLVNAGVTFSDDYTQLLSRINKRKLSDWKNDAPTDTEVGTVLMRLELPEEYDHLIAECKTATEYYFVVTKNMDASKSLRENINDYVMIDRDCVTLRRLLSLPDEYMESYRDFCVSGNTDIAMTYYKQSQQDQKEAIIKIVKAEVMGKMEEFKFFNLQKEIESDNPNVFTMWKSNSRIKEKKFEAYETYSLRDTMLIGSQPTHTCMNYRDGSYNSCLLANFDANKKIVYVKKNEKIVARAIIRLTKYTDQRQKKLDFLDVAASYEEEDDKAVIFIERLYTSHINDEDRETCEQLIVKMLQQKVSDCNIDIFVCSEYYSLYPDVLHNKKHKRVFISHTKNGVQYMDSFGGEKSKSSEAQYISCMVYC